MIRASLAATELVSIDRTAGEMIKFYDALKG